MRGKSLSRFVVVSVIGVALCFGLHACLSEPKPKPREPLMLGPTVARPALDATTQGTKAYLGGRYDEAKSFFAQAVSAAPSSGEAHYNLGLALFKLGDTEEARAHFIQAANLSPGNKVIWDSPALSPYSSPDSNLSKAKKEQPYSTTKPTFGGTGGPR